DFWEESAILRDLKIGWESRVRNHAKDSVVRLEPQPVIGNLLDRDWFTVLVAEINEFDFANAFHGVIVEVEISPLSIIRKVIVLEFFVILYRRDRNIEIMLEH